MDRREFIARTASCVAAATLPAPPVLASYGGRAVFWDDRLKLPSNNRFRFLSDNN